MSHEIERKWILPVRYINSVELQKRAMSSDFLEQGYLAVGKEEMRYRITKAGESFLTVKSRGTLVRFEREVSIPRACVGLLQNQVVGRVKKQRFKIKDGCHTIEIDLYDAHMRFDFISVEVEFKNEQTALAYELPAFLKKHAKEVTHNPAFKNENLALHPAIARREFQRLFAERVNQGWEYGGKQSDCRQRE